MNEHKQLLKDHRKLIMFCDFMVALIILFNLGALVLTNMMVVKVEPKVELGEGNPTAALVHGYTPSEPNYFKASLKYLSGTIKQSIMWFIIIAGYLFKRSILTTKADLKHLIGLLVLFLVFTGLDFMSNFGFFLGKIIYG